MISTLEPEVIRDIENGQKIRAIKKLRELRGVGLKEAKELVDLYSEQNNISSPSVTKIKSSKGVIFLTIFVIAAYYIYRHFS
ncbi:ribosomal protein L7/L12 [Gilvimarinus polysaccharolyticus]|uniref:ribosomal protein L7/L12 n=1 Tax=Gilvimarinus polysaccharolyticus TaxID=863921 RepID=UPI00067346CF|nr:ribosomal protein L7/L12 [Gilvimarinus polysaccharolyticus]